MPTIVLGQDEVDCFAAWVSATEAGLGAGHAENGSDPKVNYGSLLLQALLEYWSQPIADMDNDIRGNEYFKVPKHTPILFRFVCDLTVKFAENNFAITVRSADERDADC